MGHVLVPVLCSECGSHRGYGIAASLPKFEPPVGAHAARHSMYDPANAGPGKPHEPPGLPPLPKALPLKPLRLSPNPPMEGVRTAEGGG